MLQGPDWTAGGSHPHTREESQRTRTQDMGIRPDTWGRQSTWQMCVQWDPNFDVCLYAEDKTSKDTTWHTVAERAVTSPRGRHTFPCLNFSASSTLHLLSENATER